MQDLFQFYKTQITKHEQRLARVKQRLWASSMLRLAVFCLAVLGIYVFLGNTWGIVITVFIGAVPFLFLVSRHNTLKYRSRKLRALINLNATELRVLQRDFHHLPGGTRFKDGSHCFSQDIDLFGRGSFYQYANRTALPQGSETLAALLTENSIKGIPQKQEAIKELAQMPEWRQEFSAIASLIKAGEPHGAIVKWMANYRPFLPQWSKVLALAFGLVSIGLWILFLLDGISGWFLVAWLFLGLGITGRYLRRINAISADASRISVTFRQYQKLISELEQMDFASALLREKRNGAVEKNEPTSGLLKRFSQLLDALDQRNNVVIGLLGNGYLLRDLWIVHSMEKWISAHGHKVADWFRTIAFFDAYNSLGNFAFNHPDYVFPVLSQGDTVLRVKDAGHPLLDPQKGVRNDFEIGQQQFFIITGANMAGKSTFLRTVSLQIVMANLGLPVCAAQAEYAPIKLITSMRTSDSLTDDASYFFSELKRLRYIVGHIAEDRYFIVLDEILKGTNSTDKAQGSRKFVERLVAAKATGLIATHDLSLCETARDMPQVQNHYFDAEIVEDELYFDYKFKPGICQNMNASFLLKKMGIVE